MGRKARALSAFALGLLAVPALVYLSGRQRNPSWDVQAGPAPARTPAIDGPQLTDGYSNIRAGDYVGPETCRECHAKQYDLWRTHPHSRMNRDAGDDSVLGDFSGTRAHYGTLQATFDRDGAHHRMTFRETGPDAHSNNNSNSDSDSNKERRYRVTRTVGSRFTQMYIGVQTRGPEPPGDPVYSVERKLPFGYWLTRERWLPVNYFDSDFLPDFGSAHGGDPGIEDSERGSHADALERIFRSNRWDRNCIYCHNTYPYVERLRSGLPYMSGFPRADLSLPDASMVDGEPRSDKERMLRRRLDPDALVTLGISCESCHFGGAIHARDENVPPRFVPSAPGLHFPAASEQRVTRARDTPYVINSICAQCHAAEGVSLYPNGAGTWNSREALDLFAGACRGAIKCTDCHEPHTPGAAGGSPDNPLQVAACTSCHKQYVNAKARAAHTRHDAQVSCLDCHMPRIVQGLDAVVRSHRISSPSDPEMLAQASPNACNLCHLDRSLRWTLDALAEGWSAVEPTADWSDAYGAQLERPLAQVWAAHEVPITRLVLSDALVRSAPPARALPLLLALLEDPNPVNRMFASFALEKLLGRRLGDDEYAPTAPPSVRRRQVRTLSAALVPGADR